MNRLTAKIIGPTVYASDLNAHPEFFQEILEGEAREANHTLSVTWTAWTPESALNLWRWLMEDIKADCLIMMDHRFRRAVA